MAGPILDERVAPRRSPAGRSAPMQPHIQGLRGIAIAMVVAYHVGWPGFGGGAYGVDVFFVISGFVIAGSLLDERRRADRIGLAGFFARRIRRLLPTFTVVLLATFAALWWAWRPWERTALGPQARWSVAGLINVWSANHALAYGGPEAIDSPFSQLWSLAVEEQFYLVLAPLLAVLLAVRPNVGTARRRVGWAAGAVAVVSLVMAVRFGHGDNPAAAFYLLSARAWELLAGVVLATAAVAVRWHHPWRQQALAGVGLAVLAVTSVRFVPTGGRPSWAPVLAVAAALAVIAARPPAEGRWTPGALLSSRPLVALGAIAYPLYLWHWLALVVLTQTHPTLRAGSVVVVGSSLAAAVATHRWVEQPMRWHPRLVARPWLTIGLAAACTVALLALTVPLTRAHPLGVRPAEPGTTVDYLPTNLTPSMAWVLSRAEPDDPPCTSVSLPGGQACAFGDPEGDVTIGVMGDSHAKVWINALDAAGKANGWRIVALYQYSCSWLDLDDPDGTVDGRPCRRFRDQAVELMGAADPDLIVLTHLYRPDTTVTPADYARRAEATAARLPDGARLLVIGDVPRVPFDVPRCLLEHPDDIARCAIDPVAGTDASTRGVVADAADAVGASFVDPVPWVCPDEPCPMVRGNVLVYRDGDHLTAPFARTLAPQLGAAVEAALAAPPP